MTNKDDDTKTKKICRLVSKIFRLTCKKTLQKQKSKNEQLRTQVEYEQQSKISASTEKRKNYQLMEIQQELTISRIENQVKELEKQNYQQEIKELRNEILSGYNEFSKEYAFAMEDFYKRQGINAGDYQEHLEDYSFFKKFKEQTSKEFLELNQENKKLKQENWKLEEENDYWRELVKEEDDVLWKNYKLTYQLEQKDKEIDSLLLEKQNWQQREKDQIQHKLEILSQLNQVVKKLERDNEKLLWEIGALEIKFEDLENENRNLTFKNFRLERDKEKMNTQHWEKIERQAKEKAEKDFQSVWEALGRSQSYNEALEKHIKAFHQLKWDIEFQQTEAKIQEMPRGWKGDNWN